ncbi:hypothetical protein BGZ83_005227 [Gryganskiella cystojenkinii]|nr:hypothetical protein BGZ83_005227 [Gryganskiella cystojenkinii]
MDTRDAHKEKRMGYLLDSLPRDSNEDPFVGQILGGVDILSDSNILQGQNRDRISPTSLNPSRIPHRNHTSSAASAPPPLFGLPQETLLSILRNLTIEELQHCQQVCKVFRKLSRTILLDFLLTPTLYNNPTTALVSAATRIPIDATNLDNHNIRHITETSHNLATMPTPSLLQDPTLFTIEFAPNDGQRVCFRCISVDRSKEQLVYQPLQGHDNWLTIILDLQRCRWLPPIHAMTATYSNGVPLPRSLPRSGGPSGGLNLFDYRTGLKREAEDRHYQHQHPFNSLVSGVSSLFSSSWRSSTKPGPEDSFTVLSIRHNMWPKEIITGSRRDRQFQWEMSDAQDDTIADREPMVCLMSEGEGSNPGHHHHNESYNPSTLKREGPENDAEGQGRSKIHRHFVGCGSYGDRSYHKENSLNTGACRCCLHHRPLRTVTAGRAGVLVPTTVAGTRGWSLEYSLESKACCPCETCEVRGMIDANGMRQQQAVDQPSEEEDESRREVRIMMQQLRVSLDWVLSGIKTRPSMAI